MRRTRILLTVVVLVANSTLSVKAALSTKEVFQWQRLRERTFCRLECFDKQAGRNTREHRAMQV